jgi:hypothetical protein
MGMFAIRKALYRLALYKGETAEKRSLLAITSNCHELPWIDRARTATRSEDLRGTDIVIYTKDIGKLYVQIKSSMRGADKYRQKYPGRIIAIIIIREEYSDDVVWGEVRKAIVALRNNLLNKRGY